MILSAADLCDLSPACVVLCVIICSSVQLLYRHLWKTLQPWFVCKRWGQVFILDALSKYKAKDARDAENIVERVTPRLQHANCAVVLSAVKVFIYMNQCQS